MNSVTRTIALVIVEKDPYAEVHDPEHPLRLVLPMPDRSLVESDDAGVNLSTDELRALRDACTEVLEAYEAEQAGLEP